MTQPKRIRVDGKCGKVTKLIGRNVVRIKIKGLINQVEMPVALLKASKSFDKLSLGEMEKVLKKPHHGVKKGENVCISREEPLYD